MEFKIEPIEFQWGEWSELFKSLEESRRDLLTSKGLSKNTREAAMQLLELVSVWHREVTEWAKQLNEKKRRDCVELLIAETDLLSNLIDPAAHAPSGYFPKPPGDYECYEFRQRWYSAAALLRVAEEHSFPDVERARSMFDDLERFAMEKEWLP